MSKYVFRTEPFAHQRTALELGWDKKFFAYFLDMGTGKSKVALDNVGILHQQGEIDGALIVAPKTVCRNWFDQEIPKHVTEYVAELWGTRGIKGGGDYSCCSPYFFIINVEALRTKKGFAAAREFLDEHRAIMIVDESTTIKNHKAKRSKAAMKLGALAKYRRILTGSPVTRSPLDLWGQCEFLEPGCLGDSSYWSFRARYATMFKRHLAGGRSFQQITGYQNLDQLGRIVAGFSYRVTKEECLDLPPKIYQTRHVEMTKEQKKAYGELRDDLQTEFKEHGNQCHVDTVLAQLVRMQQVLSGWLPITQLHDDKPPSQTTHTIPSNRPAALTEILEETNGSVVIWCRFLGDVAQVVRAAVDSGRELKEIGQLTGIVSPENRARVIEAFQAGEVTVMVGTTDTGGMGIELTAASTVVYYSHNWDLLLRQQSEDRSHRHGQDKSVTYVDFMVPGTIDEKILQSYKDKKGLAEEIATASREEIESWV